MQVYAQNKDGNEIVVAALFTINKNANYGLEKLNIVGGRPGMPVELYKMKDEGILPIKTIGDSKYNFDLSIILGEPKNWIRYNGSCSSYANNCKEVTWLVIYELIPIAQDQLNMFEAPSEPISAKNPKAGQLITQNKYHNVDNVVLPPPLQSKSETGIYPN